MQGIAVKSVTCQCQNGQNRSDLDPLSTTHLELGSRALNLTIVARCIERIADHCKNIAEEVYYLYQAVDIRHDRTNAPVPESR